MGTDCTHKWVQSYVHFYINVKNVQFGAFFKNPLIICEQTTTLS